MPTFRHKAKFSPYIAEQKVVYVEFEVGYNDPYTQDVVIRLLDGNEVQVVERIAVDILPVMPGDLSVLQYYENLSSTVMTLIEGAALVKGSAGVTRGLLIVGELGTARIRFDTTPVERSFHLAVVLPGRSIAVSPLINTIF